MARYFLHLHECGICFEDNEGFECVSLADARKIALNVARDIMAEEVRAGMLCLSCNIAVEDSEHQELLTVPFVEALHITGR